MKIRSLVAVAPIVSDASASARFYRDALGLPLTGEEDSYLSTEALTGIRHFGLWRLCDAARSCLGREDWPPDLPTPQACVEFDVEDVESAVRELEAAGYQS